MNQTAHAPSTIDPYSQPPPRSAPVWSDARVEALTRAWRAGQSASQIAAELGEGLSRCAVIGKLHRLGLCGGYKPSTPRPKTKGDGDAAPVASTASNAAIPWARKHPVATPATWLEIGPDALPTSAAGAGGTPPASPGPKYLRDMARRECRYGLGDPGLGNGAFQLFCAAPTTGQAYCAHHRSLAYRQPSSVIEQNMNVPGAEL